MKAITNELHKTLLVNLARLPMDQIELLVVGLRGALDVPLPIAEDLERGAKAKHAAALRLQLIELDKSAPPGKEPPPEKSAPPGKEPPPSSNGEADRATAT